MGLTLVIDFLQEIKLNMALICHAPVQLILVVFIVLPKNDGQQDNVTLKSDFYMLSSAKENNNWGTFKVY